MVPRRNALLVLGGLALSGLVLTAAPSAGSGPAASGPRPDPRQPVVHAVARDLAITGSQARERLAAQVRAHRILDELPGDPLRESAGVWFDAASGDLVVAVTDRADAGAVRAAGARPEYVAHDRRTLARLLAGVRELARGQVPGLVSYGVDVRANRVRVAVTDAATERFRSAVRSFGAGVKIKRVPQRLVQHSGDANPGDPWWPGGESNCSIGFGATDASGGLHFVTAGHCTNDADQPAYGEPGQQNRLGTSNVGGGRSVNAREGDMGVVAVTEPGWTLSAEVNTWGEPAITVIGPAEAIVGDTVCHSGNTAPNFECGTVNSVDQTVDYGNVVIDGLTLTTACSQGGDSGGAWLRGDQAVGLHSGGVSTCSPGQDGDNSVFQPVNEALEKWELTLYTGTGTE